MDAIPQQQQVWRICLLAAATFLSPLRPSKCTSPNVHPCLPIGSLLHNSMELHAFSLTPPASSFCSMSRWAHMLEMIKQVLIQTLNLFSIAKL
jgi:hypothetical protein